MKDEHLTIKKVAKILKISIRRVNALILDNRIKAKKIGNCWLILDYSKAKNRKNGRPKKK